MKNVYKIGGMPDKLHDVKIASRLWGNANAVMLGDDHFPVMT